MKSVEDFSKIFDLQDRHAALISAEFDALVEMIYGLYGKNGVSKFGAQRFLIESLFKFLKVCEDEGLAQKDQIAQRLENLLKSDIESLPHAYTLRIELPRMPRIGKFRLSITESISLVCDEHNFEAREIDLPPNIKQYGIGLSGLRIPELRCYLQISLSGYLGASSDIQESDLVSSPAKQVAYWLVRGDAFFEGSGPNRAKITLERHHIGDVVGIRISDSLAKCLGNVGLSETKLQVYDHSGKTLLGGQFRPAISQDEKIKALEESIKPTIDFFRCEDQQDFQGVAAAIEWYQDSLYMENQTLSLIAACIGLEAVMGGGDSHLEQMSARLADRYAYMLGKSREARKKLAENYKKVLKRRGELVHARTGQLSDDDQAVLYLAQDMLRKVINHEADGMRRRLKTQK